MGEISKNASEEFASCSSTMSKASKASARLLNRPRGDLALQVKSAPSLGSSRLPSYEKGPRQQTCPAPQDMARAVNTPGETFDRATSGIWPKVLRGQLRPSAPGTLLFHGSFSRRNRRRRARRKWATRPQLPRPSCWRPVSENSWPIVLGHLRRHRHQPCPRRCRSATRSPAGSAPRVLRWILGGSFIAMADLDADSRQARRRRRPRAPRTSASSAPR